MKKLLFATVLAIAAAAPFAASAQDQIIIRNHERHDDNGWRHREHDRGGLQFGIVVGGPDREIRRHHRHYRRDCETRWVHKWRHHHRVVEKITICD